MFATATQSNCWVAAVEGRPHGMTNYSKRGQSTESAKHSTISFGLDGNMAGGKMAAFWGISLSL